MSTALTPAAPTPTPAAPKPNRGHRHRRRHRRASANTRIFGHYMAEEKPRATWAVGILRLERDPGGNALRDTLWERANKMGRFRSRLVVSRWGGYWEELTEEELLELRDTGYLWQEVLTDGTGTDADVDRVVADVSSWQYDRNKPLWKAMYARKLADGSAALIFVCSHGIGDGISLVATLFNLCDDMDVGGVPTKLHGARGSLAAPPAKRAKPPKLGPVTKARAFAYGAFQGLTSSSWTPDRNKTLALPDVTKPSTEKRLAHAEPIPLDEMKAVKNKFPGATLNDVMMAVLTATVRSYLEEVGDPAAKGGEKIRVGFPVNLRTPNEPILRDGDPMNKWAYGLFTLDFRYKSRIELVWKVKHQIDKIKVSPSPLIQYHTLKALMRSLPRKTVLNLALNAANIACFQLSNVPGPSTHVYIAGVKVNDISFALHTPLSLYVGIMSYAGTVSAGVCADASTKIDAARFAQHWKAEFEALKKECDAFPDSVPLPRRAWF